MTDWDGIQLDFEHFGESKQAICEKHEISRRMLNNAITAGSWRPPTPTINGSPADDNEADNEEAIEKLNQSLSLKHARHQANLLPKYINIEKSFLDRLQEKAASFECADDAKKIAETLMLIKPDIMKQSERGTGKGNESGRVLIVNQFPVPQPGDDHYVAPNSVLIGKEAGKGTDISNDRSNDRSNDVVDLVGADYEVIEVPDYEDMN